MRYLSLLLSFAVILVGCVPSDVSINDGDNNDITVVFEEPEPVAEYLVTVIDAEFDDPTSSFVAFGHVEGTSYASDTCVTPTAWSTDTPYWAAACAFEFHDDAYFTVDLWVEAEDGPYIEESFSWENEAITDLIEAIDVPSIALVGDDVEITIRVDLL